MNKIKKILIAIMLFAITFACSPLCFANNTIYSSGNMPAQVKASNKFTVDLLCECSERLGTTTFVISYGGNVTYNSCKVNDSDNGYIVDVENNGNINITYLNTSGIDISKNKKLAEITMKSGEIGDCWIEIKTIYSASSNEQTITDSNSTHYEIDVVEKVTNTSNASGTSLQNNNSSSKSSSSRSSSSGSSSSKNSSKKKAVSQSSLTDDIASNTDGTDEKSDSVDMIDLSEKPNNIIVFVAGGVFAVSIAMVVIVSYNMGKKRSEEQSKSE